MKTEKKRKEKKKKKKNFNILFLMRVPNFLGIHQHMDVKWPSYGR
jgi:hypothetical protein